MEDARRFSRKMKHFAFFLLYDSISHTQQQRLASSYYWTSLIAPSRSVFDNERKEMQVNRMRECNLFKNFFSSVCFWKCLRKASSHQGKKLCLVRWCLIFLETRGCGRANERTHSETVLLVNNQQEVGLFFFFFCWLTNTHEKKERTNNSSSGHGSLKWNESGAFTPPRSSYNDPTTTATPEMSFCATVMTAPSSRRESPRLTLRERDAPVEGERGG